ncbi:MAG TPA: winged helix-turn-helix domain-containing protein [Stellaceae bacterium]
MNPGTDASARLEFGRFQILPHRRELLANGQLIKLGGRAFDVLMALIEAGGVVVGKDALMARAWPGRVVEENSLQAQISALRAVFGSDRDLIRTIAGRGYQFTGSVRILPTSPDERAALSLPAVELKAPRSPTNLPEPVSELIGREEEVSEILNLATTHRLVTLTGPGGIGKTRLALAIARELLPHFADGVWLAEFSPLADPGLVPAAVAGAVGLDLGGGAVSEQRVAQALANRRLLLVLDTCEHVIAAAAALAEAVLRAGSAARIIATSREPLRAEGEWVYPAPPLALPMNDRESSDDPLQYGAIQLFVQRARAAEPHFGTDRRLTTTISTICRQLDGIPLAIELAAARASALGIEALASRLDDRFHLLTGGRRTALPRHQTLRATLDWSYALLAEPERVILRRLAAFAGAFSLEAAGAVIATAELAPAKVVEELSNLVAKSLVTTEVEGPVTRYRLLDSTRAYALEKLDESGERAPLARRHAEYYRDLFERADAESESRPQAEWLAIYGPHLDNVRAGLDWAFSLDGDPQIGVALTVAVLPLWVQFSLLSECRDKVERALAHLEGDEAATMRSRMQLSAALGWSLMYGVGRAREAGPALATTLDLAERLGDQVYRLRALWSLCIDQFNNGNCRTALEFARRFAGLASDSGDPVDLMMADRLLATAQHYFGDQQAAHHHIDRALTRLNGLTPQTQIVRVRFDMRVSTHYFQARILWLQGFAEQALRVVEHNIEEGNAVGQALSYCSVLGQAACPIAFWAGHLDAAEHYGALLRDHTERHPIRLWNVWARCFIGLVIARRHDIAAGLRALRDGLGQVGEARFLPRFQLLLAEMAACLAASGEVELGLETVDEALARCQAREELWYMTELLRIKGELLLMQGASGGAAAENQFRQALDWARRQGALAWELRAATRLARLLRDEGRSSDAKALLQPVYDRFTEGYSTADLTVARTLLDALQ